MADARGELALRIIILILTSPIWILCILALFSFIGQLGSSDGRKDIKKNWDKEKYCNYIFTCPMCGSKKVKRIGTASRAVSVATVGLASGKIGKQYECDNCKHKW